MQCTLLRFRLCRLDKFTFTNYLQMQNVNSTFCSTEKQTGGKYSHKKLLNTKLEWNKNRFSEAD